MTATYPTEAHSTPVPPAKKEGTFWHPAPGGYYVANPPRAAKDAAGPAGAPRAAATADRPEQNAALSTLWWLGALLFIGGFIAILVGANRHEPIPSRFDSASEIVINSANFANTTALTLLIGGGTLLLGGTALVGALVATAVKTALGGPANLPVAQK